MDYQGNANKDRDPEEKGKEKNVEKVVTGAVIVQKKSLGRKFKDLFVHADLRNSVRYVFVEVMVPAARNLVVDATTKGIERMVYGESAVRRRNYGTPGPRVTYNSPVRRDYRQAPPVPSGPRRPSRQNRGDFILSSREEAEVVLERMRDIIDKYEVASVADLNELVGFPSNHVDNKWGWVFLDDVPIRQIREGYLLDLPAEEPIQ